MAILRRLVLALVGTAALWGCFSPRQPACAFSCVADGICPTGYSCAADGLCHRVDAQGICDLPPQTDAGSDGPSDAEDDGPGASDAAGDGG